MAMENVVTAENPRATALALFLQDVEHNILVHMGKSAELQGAHVTRYVFDGLYILGRDAEHLRQVYTRVAEELWSFTMFMD